MLQLALVPAAAAVGVTAISWVRQRPQRAVLLLAALLPFHGLLLFLPPAAAKLAAWKEGLVGLVLVGALTAVPSARRSTQIARPPWLVPLVALVTLGIAAIAVTSHAVYATGFKVMFFYTAVTVALWRCPLDGRERDKLVSILMVTGVVTAAVGIAQQFLGGDRLAKLGLDWNTALRTSGGRLRSISTFAQPFPFAFYVALVITIGVAVSLADPHRRRNRLFLLATPLLTFGMLTAIVRGAIVALAVGLAYLTITRHRALLHLSIVAIVGVFLVPGGIFKVFTSSTSLDQRSTGWGYTVSLIAAKPLGWGLGSVGAAAEKIYPDGIGAEGFGLPTSQLPYHPDNQFVGDGLQLGVLGLWSFVLVIRGAFRHARHESVRARSPSDGALARGIAATVLGAAVSALVANYWEIFPLDAYFWMLLGVLLSISASSTTPSPSDPEAAASRPTSATSLVPSVG